MQVIERGPAIHLLGWLHCPPPFKIFALFPLPIAQPKSETLLNKCVFVFKFMHQLVGHFLVTFDASAEGKLFDSDLRFVVNISKKQTNC